MTAFATASPAAYQQQSIMTAPPERLVVMLYDGAIRFFFQAAAALREDARTTALERLDRGEAIVDHLLATLDMSAGRDGAAARGHLRLLQAPAHGGAARARRRQGRPRARLPQRPARGVGADLARHERLGAAARARRARARAGARRRRRRAARRDRRARAPDRALGAPPPSARPRARAPRRRCRSRSSWSSRSGATRSCASSARSAAAAAPCAATGSPPARRAARSTALPEGEARSRPGMDARRRSSDAVRMTGGALKLARQADHSGQSPRIRRP